MANSSSSQHRAQLIREMSKDMNRTRNSSGSSRGSQAGASPEPTTSDFDPEHEAIMSTRQLDSHSQQLPELRASAQKFSRFGSPVEPDFAINTSAIGQAFPDFSQGGMSSDEDSISIEIGRGVKRGSSGTIGKLGRSREYSPNVQLSLDDGDSMDFSAPMIGNYEVTTTPPLRQRQALRKADDDARGSIRRETPVRKPSGLRKEMSDPSPPPVKTQDYGSGESRKSSGESRRTLASIHARIRDENDEFRVGDERPPTVDLTARNTRFGNTKNLQPSSQPTLPTRFSSAQALLNSVAPINKQKLQASGTPNQGTQQSFMLPDLPNISELVSGVFEDGTPVFSRHGRSRASRFSPAQTNKNTKQEYASVHDIAVPDDEQAIFLSLKLLQDKVATLERSNAEAATSIDELQEKNRALMEEKRDRRRAPRSDSALGTTDSDGGRDIGSGERRLLIEKSRLEASNKTLQQQFDVVQRKYSTTETILRQITQERDSAVSQLGVAFVTIEQLKADNESLKDENNQLRVRTGPSGDEHREEMKNLTAKGKSSRKELLQRAEEVKSVAQKVDSHIIGPNLTRNSSSRAQGDMEMKRRAAETLAPKDVDTIFNLSSKQNVGKSQKEKNDGRMFEDSTDSMDEVSQRVKKGKNLVQPSYPSQSIPDNETGQDLTYLSFLDNREIAQLRRTLEQERIERKQRQNPTGRSSRLDSTTTQSNLLPAVSQSSQKAAPRKSSMKDLAARPTKQRGATETHNLDPQLEHNRRHSDSSILSTRGRRRGPDAENMTSAFILPDITLKTLGVNNAEMPKLIRESQEMVTAHNGQNCTVCKRMINVGEQQHEHSETTEKIFKITKPIPVSERMPKTSEDDGEPTIRPAQAPGIALATVLKELEDEIVHLKIELSQYQTLYNCHDPALSKRRRKSVQQKIESTLQAIDIKADQIYALYDVLEGQKQDGHELSDEEVEITLQSIGVKAPELHLRGGDRDEDEGKEKPTERHPWDLESDGESSEGLPWEGIESTVETTRSGFARTARRSGIGA